MSEQPVTDTTEPTRLVQVGAGSMGRGWLGTIRDEPAARLVGLVDLDVETARRAVTDLNLDNVVISDSLADLLDEVAADAVVNVTIPEAHREVSTVALLRGLPVLSEKPAAESTAAALSMAAAAELSGRLLMVSQSRRYLRVLDAFRSQVTRLGPVGWVECSFFKAPHFGGFRDQMPYPLLVDMAIHHFDLARQLIGSDPRWISCESFNPSWSWYAGDAAAQVTAEFENRTRFSFTGSWCSPGIETSWNGSWRVSGAGGTAVWDGDNEPRAETADGRTIPAEPGTGPEGIAGSLAEFIAALRTGVVPSGEIHRNAMSLAMVEAATRSAEAGVRVVVADLLRRAHREAIEAERRPEIRAVLAAWPDIGSVVRAQS